MTVTDKFMDDSARAAIRSLRSLEQTAIMLEKWAPDVFPETTEVNGVVQKHFGRVMMESAAQAIRDSWAAAIKEMENADRVNQIEIYDEMLKAIKGLMTLHEPEGRFQPSHFKPFLYAATAVITKAEDFAKVQVRE